MEEEKGERRFRRWKVRGEEKEGGRQKWKMEGEGRRRGEAKMGKGDKWEGSLR